MADKSNSPGTILGNAIYLPRWSVLGNATISHKGGNPWHDPKTGRFTSGPGNSKNVQPVRRGLGLTPSYGGPIPLTFKGQIWLNYRGKVIQWPSGVTFQDVYDSGVNAWYAQLELPSSAMIAAGAYFSPGGIYDFQRSPYPDSKNIYIDATSVAIGIWAVGAGMSLDEIQQINNMAAWNFSEYTPSQISRNPLDKIYKNTTTRNVENIKFGYKIGEYLNTGIRKGF